MTLLALLLSLAAASIHNGNIVVRSGSADRAITSGGGYSDPAISPDGRQVTFIHQDDAAGDQGHSSLWVAPVAVGPPRRLLAGRENDAPERNLALVSGPHWSLDGRFVYVDAAAWATSSAVHRVEVATGRTRFVVAGGVVGVVRGGRWRGYLLVSQHKYRGAPNFGSYEAVSLIRPDGRVEFRIPGSDTDEGKRSVPRWLRAQHTTAS